MADVERADKMTAVLAWSILDPLVPNMLSTRSRQNDFPCPGSDIATRVAQEPIKYNIKRDILADVNSQSCKEYSNRYFVDFRGFSVYNIHTVL